MSENDDIVLLLEKIKTANNRIKLSEKDKMDKIKNIFDTFHKLYDNIGIDVLVTKKYKTNNYNLLVSYDEIHYTEKNIELIELSDIKYKNKFIKNIWNRKYENVATLIYDYCHDTKKEYYSMGNELFLEHFYAKTQEIVKYILDIEVINREKYADKIESENEIGLINA